MKLSDATTIIRSHIQAGDTKTVHHLTSSPGVGKTASIYQLAKELKFDHFADLNASLLDTPDLAGLALMGDTGSDVLSFKKSPLLAPIQTGRNLVLFDEAADAPMAMQNLIRRLMWTRELNGLRASAETYFVLASNRTKDKSGAGRLSGKVKTATTQLEVEANLDDWVTWALDNNIDPVLIQFLRFRPPLLDGYDPDAEVSPTPRQWELVSYVPASLPTGLFFKDVAGKVGDGPASEYTAFRKVYAELPSPEEVVMNPTTIKISDEPSVRFAITGSMVGVVNSGNVERIAQFMERLPKTFGTMFWQDATRKTPALKASKPFIQWATSTSNVVLN